jgi:hypothetical protein
LLSISQCRELLGEKCPKADDEVERLREQFYQFAHTVVDLSDMLLLHPEQLIAELPDDERGSVEERVAILEFDGGVSRRLAERKAFAASFRSRKANR